MSYMEGFIRVTVTPSQSSYFAGEEFSATITFKNTRTHPTQPNTPASALRTPSALRTHKKAAHSVSSAPLAKPPTSPGPSTPRTAVQGSHARMQRGVSGAESPGRKGLIGDGIETSGLGIAGWKARHTPRALSVSVSPNALPVLGEVGVKSASYLPRSFGDEQQQLPYTPRLASSLSRSSSLPLSPDHPHARKKSVLDGSSSAQFQLQESISPPSHPHSQSHSPYPSHSPYSQPHHQAPSTPPSSSTYSLALDPIAEFSFSNPSSPSNTHASTSVPPSTTSLKPPFEYPAPPTQRAASPPFPVTSTPPVNKTKPNRSNSASFTHLPHSQDTEVILYAYAHLVGTLTLSTSNTSANANATPTTTERMLRSVLLGHSRAAVGGGSMDITPSLAAEAGRPTSAAVINSHRRKTSVQLGGGGGGMASLGVPSNSPARAPHRRSTSFGGSLLSFLSASPNPAPPPPSSSSHANGSAPGRSMSNSISDPGGWGWDPDKTRIAIDQDVPLPTLETQPVMLVVDLALGPGEERSYSYKFTIPENLPPTFRGEHLKFSYDLVLGACRRGSTPSTSSAGAGPRSSLDSRGGAGSGGSGMSAAAGGGIGGVSRVMKLPVRVYNHVSVRRPHVPYDLLWPVARRRQAGADGASAEIRSGRVDTLPLSQEMAITRDKQGVSSSPSVQLKQTTLDDVRSYALDLLRVSSSGKPGSGIRLRRDDGEGDDEDDEDAWRREDEGAGGMTGCREAVEVLTRVSKKVSYDVNKDGVQVAVLTFSKSAYRLGETVLGVVDVNERIGRSRVLKLSAFLETHETLPSSLLSSATGSAGARPIKRVHAEHHSSFMTNTRRTTFALDIPSDAAPGFKVHAEAQAHTYTNNPRSGLHNGSVSVSTKPGGLEWRLRLCLLVAVADETADLGTEGVALKSLVRDGEKGEWGSSWRACAGVAPMQRRREVKTKPALGSGAGGAKRPGLEHLQTPGGEGAEKPPQRSTSWSAFFAEKILGAVEEDFVHAHHRSTHGRTGDSDSDSDLESQNGGEDHGWPFSPSHSSSGGTRYYDGIKPNLAGGVGVPISFGGKEKGWEEVGLETVECEVPVGVWPGNTAYKAVDVVFDV